MTTLKHVMNGLRRHLGTKEVEEDRDKLTGKPDRNQCKCPFEKCAEDVGNTAQGIGATMKAAHDRATKADS